MRLRRMEYRDRAASKIAGPRLVFSAYLEEIDGVIESGRRPPQALRIL
jgi:hypothetical protein